MKKESKGGAAQRPASKQSPCPKQILHKRVMVTGWLFYDSIHEHNAANTSPHGTQIWRLTCEETHPASGIKVLH
jgi:hypothetical protein